MKNNKKTKIKPYSMISNIPQVDKWKKEINAEVYKETKYYQKVYKFEISEGEHDTWNNEADAFKHTFASAWLAFKYNNLTSKAVGNFHEGEGKEGDQDIEEEIMDRHNNNIGRIIAKQIKKEYPNWNKLLDRELKDIIAKKVMDKMNRDILIKNPNEAIKKRPEEVLKKYNEYYKNIDDVNENIKRIHDNKNKSSSKTFLPNKIDEPSKKDRIILNSILYTFENTDKGWEHKYKIMHTLPKVLRAVANVNNMPLTDVVDLLIKSIKNHKRNQEIEEGRISAPALGSGSGHWVTINGNHVFIEDK